MPPRTPRFPRPLALPTFRLSGHMAKADTKPTKQPPRLIQKNGSSGLLQPLESGALMRALSILRRSFSKAVPPKPSIRATWIEPDRGPSRAVRFCTEAFDRHGHDGMRSSCGSTKSQSCARSATNPSLRRASPATLIGGWGFATLQLARRLELDKKLPAPSPPYRGSGQHEASVKGAARVPHPRGHHVWGWVVALRWIAAHGLGAALAAPATGNPLSRDVLARIGWPDSVPAATSRPAHNGYPLRLTLCISSRLFPPIFAMGMPIDGRSIDPKLKFSGQASFSQPLLTTP